MTLTLLRLLQLASPTLPVGAYTYSQGLEWAVESGRVGDEASAARWIGDLLEWNLASFEAPLMAASMQAWRDRDGARLRRLNEDFLASRESAELREETIQMGYSMARLLADLDPLIRHREGAAPLELIESPSYPLAWAWAASAAGIGPGEALSAYLWAWLENQVMAAVKCVPLGQTAGQRVLASLAARIPALAAEALEMPESAWGNFAPGLAIASARHETQYSRLFRS